ncbi:adenylate/guanylate cyclase domain-containing protein [Legionella maioricensis]|uniref:Adenylate/guanylate cyclase domain-containing protein n=1 Tax=Legionella maioricensis TaxID=2896528 RepID=A0A9X2D0J2_9GAMM|nr:adenylate/guanylate cyclase domain-containing protein [Legionella maioricensis]MCL9684355.1 adenylate/guanylate cyclase domain-containing protein [Legionella maioricensis]MCL9688783.1 adenylate/guanylate cyclase domain-containing protein [Legionella maioricensis]
MIGNLFKKINQLIIPLKSSMLFIFISLFLITALLILLVATVRYTKILTYIAHEHMKHASEFVLRELTENINPAAVNSQFTGHLIQQNIIKAGPAQLVPLTMGMVKTLPLVAGAYWGDQQGNFIYSQKEKNGTITSEIYNRLTHPATHTIINRDNSGKIIKQYLSPDLSYDHRKRVWYHQAQKEKKTIWTDIYFFDPPPDVGITTASPVFKDGKFYGAFGIDINLITLTEFIKNQKITAGGYSFIITNKGKLIAYPNKKPFTDMNVSTGKFHNVHNDSIPLIDKSLELYKKSGQEKLTFSYKHEGENYMINYEPVEALKSYGWLIGIVVPESDFISDLRRINLMSLYISFIILLLGILFVSGLVARIVRPLKSLVAETENIKHFNLDGEISIKSRIKEIIQLRDAVHSMKIGLKLFQRYIPKILVRQLIESGEDVRIGGVRKTLTVFFSDIEHFATLAEKTEPNLLMIQMGEYLEELTQIIIAEKGTIDKYIGDAIMAFWGAPLPNDNPCYHAARAALRCQLKLNELNTKWEKEGKKILFTRIGIHMGDAIVGNLGSSERLNYTALGDSINIASRLESINKNYKTKIIVSDTVYEQIKDQFLFRMIDCVVVEGRTQSCCIYELLTDNALALEFDLGAYNPCFEKGFSAYKEQRWDEAIVCFKKCLEIYPADAIAPIFIARCQQFKTQPPKSGWNGIME